MDGGFGGGGGFDVDPNIIFRSFFGGGGDGKISLLIRLSNNFKTLAVVALVVSLVASLAVAEVAMVMVMVTEAPEEEALEDSLSASDNTFSNQIVT